MSFFVNNVELKEATFNQQEVKSIYFNTHLIWEAASWPGWANATWEDVYNLCKAKQEGEIIAWPNDVVLGATKETTLSTAVSGLTTYTMRIIGLDIDGSGIVTFDCNHILTYNYTLVNTKTGFSACFRFPWRLIQDPLLFIFPYLCRFLLLIFAMFLNFCLFSAK